MKRLAPIEEDAYVCSNEWDAQQAGDSDDSSDDEVQSAMRAYMDGAGRRGSGRRVLEPTSSASAKNRQDKDEFESAMAADLDRSLDEHCAAHLGGAFAKLLQSPRAAKATAAAASSPTSKSSPAAKKGGKLVKPPPQQPATSSAAEPQPTTTTAAAAGQTEKKKKKVQWVNEADELAETIGLNEQHDGEDGENNAEAPSAPQPSNDELMYDPEEDEANQKWADDRQTGRTGIRSDAVLSCPACMTQLCRDCQRHSLYKTQYRAMFVQSCQVQFSSVLYMPSGPTRKARKALEQRTGVKSNERLASAPGNVPPADLFYPVTCTVCRTEVGVYDHDEVYHFFNVLSGYV